MTLDFDHNSVSLSPETAKVFDLARTGSLDENTLCLTASDLEKTGRTDLAIALYRAWLYNSDSPMNGNAWFNLAVLLLNSQDLFACEQALLNALHATVPFEAARGALEKIDFSANRNRGPLYTMFMLAREGRLEVEFFIAAYGMLNNSDNLPLLYELFRLWLKRGKSPKLYVLCYEFGLVSARLGYRQAARLAFESSLALNPDFELPKLAQSNTVPLDLMVRLSMFYTIETVTVLTDIRAQIPVSVYLSLYNQWLEHNIANSPYITAYKLGVNFKKVGRFMEAKTAFAHCLKLNPYFGRARFELRTEENPGQLLAERIERQSLFEAMDMRTKTLQSPRLPSRLNPDLSPTERLIVKAPHLYRALVANNLRYLDAQSQLEKNSELDELSLSTLQLQADNALHDNACIKLKFAAMENGRQQKTSAINGKTALLVCVKGVGDHIHLNGAVRYLATHYDQVVVATMWKQPAGILEMFQDDPSIRWQYFDINYFSSENVTHIPALMEESFGNDVFYCNEYYRACTTTLRIPQAAYEQLNMDPAIAATYFHIEEKAEGDALLEIARSTANRFVFSHCAAHNDSNFPVVAAMVVDNPQTFFINPDANFYPPGHKFHDAAQHFLNKPIFSYIQVMSNAAELHLIDSSFYALSHYIQRIEGQSVVCYIRNVHPLHFYEKSSELFPQIKLIMLD